MIGRRKWVCLGRKKMLKPEHEKKQKDKKKKKQSKEINERKTARR